jgi:hypothetical protein
MSKNITISGNISNSTISGAHISIGGGTREERKGVKVVVRYTILVDDEVHGEVVTDNEEFRVTLPGDVGSVHVERGSVTGEVKAGGSVTVGEGIAGDVRAGTSLTCLSVGGNARSGTALRIGSKS